MSNAEYHAVPGISASSLKLLEESPRHLQQAHLFKRPPSPAMDFGTLIHAAVLEPETLPERFIAMPKFDGRTKEGKAAREQFEADNAGKTVISQDDLDAAERIAENVRAIASGILTGGAAEQSFFVDDNGLTLKCRPDYYIEAAGVVVDLKTIADISEFGIRKAITNYRYDRQDAHYLRTLRIGGHIARSFIFVFIESAPPHMVKIREIDAQSRMAADYEIETLLAGYREYLRSGAASLIKTVIPFGGSI